MHGHKPPTDLTPQQAARLRAALTADADELFAVIQDPSAEVLRATLKNRALDERHVLALLKRRDLSEDLLKAVYRLEQTKASRRIRLALVKNPNVPGPILRTLLPQLYLFELVAICYLPGVSPDQKLAAERLIIQRLPTVPLGTKITLARRATADVAAALLLEGLPALMEPCLGNPRLKEMAVARFLRSAAANAETISAVARHARWQPRPALRQAILKNPRTPTVWHTLWLPKLRSPELKQLAASPRLVPAQKKIVREEMRKRGLV
jgi:hypothetical protein